MAWSTHPYYHGYIPSNPILTSTQKDTTVAIRPQWADNLGVKTSINERYLVFASRWCSYTPKCSTVVCTDSQYPKADWAGWMGVGEKDPQGSKLWTYYSPRPLIDGSITVSIIHQSCIGIMVPGACVLHACFNFLWIRLAVVSSPNYSPVLFSAVMFQGHARRNSSMMHAAYCMYVVVWILKKTFSVVTVAVAVAVAFKFNLQGPIFIVHERNAGWVLLVSLVWYCRTWLSEVPVSWDLHHFSDAEVFLDSKQSMDGQDIPSVPAMDACFVLALLLVDNLVASISNRWMSCEVPSKPNGRCRRYRTNLQILP
jgi:hypothetical protein